MSKVVEVVVVVLDLKVKGFDGIVKFVIEGEGVVYIDVNGVCVVDDEVDVILIVSCEIFEGLLLGDVNLIMVFMIGKLKVDGLMGMVMKLGLILG